MTTAVLVAALSACGTPAPSPTGDSSTAPAEASPAVSSPAVSSPLPTAGDIPAPAQRAPAPAATSAVADPPSPSAPATPRTLPSASPPATAGTEPPELSDPASVTVVVNKQRPLNPIDYSPSGLVLPAVPLAVAEPNALLRGDTGAAVEDMFAAAADDGVGLTLVSGYRSYQDQVSTYQHWVAQNGGSTAAADRISARAGFSEHQTGLAFDVGQSDGACTLSACFADTPAGQWTAANAHGFGFILRYPADAESITGFSGESWHFRYVGVQLAGQMRAQGVATLEEYFDLPPAPGY